MSKLMYSPLTDHVYIVGKNGKKTAVTNDFLHCVVSRWGGFTQKISSGDKCYEITVKETKPASFAAAHGLGCGEE